MAKRNSNGQLQGSISNRIQVKNPITDRWVKMDTDSGRIIEHKASEGPYKGVRKKT